MSLSIYKNIYFMLIEFRFFNGKWLQYYLRRERQLIHLVRRVTKEEKITQYDVNTHETVLV